MMQEKWSSNNSDQYRMWQQEMFISRSLKSKHQVAHENGQTRHTLHEVLHKEYNFCPRKSHYMQGAKTCRLSLQNGQPLFLLFHQACGHQFCMTNSYCLQTQCCLFTFPCMPSSLILNNGISHFIACCYFRLLLNSSNWSSSFIVLCCLCT